MDYLAPGSSGMPDQSYLLTLITQISCQNCDDSSRLFAKTEQWMRSLTT